MTTNFYTKNNVTGKIEAAKRAPELTPEQIALKELRKAKARLALAELAERTANKKAKSRKAQRTARKATRK